MTHSSYASLREMMAECKDFIAQKDAEIKAAKASTEFWVQEAREKAIAVLQPLLKEKADAEAALARYRKRYSEECCAPKANSDPPLPVRQALVDAICHFEEYKGYRSFQRLCDETGVPCRSLHDWKRMTAPLQQDRERFKGKRENEIVATIKNIILTTIQ